MDGVGRDLGFGLGGLESSALNFGGGVGGDRVVDIEGLDFGTGEGAWGNTKLRETKEGILELFFSFGLALATTRLLREQQGRSCGRWRWWRDYVR